MLHITSYKGNIRQVALFIDDNTNTCDVHSHSFVGVTEVASDEAFGSSQWLKTPQSVLSHFQGATLPVSLRTCATALVSNQTIFVPVRLQIIVDKLGTPFQSAIALRLSYNDKRSSNRTTILRSIVGDFLSLPQVNRSEIVITVLSNRTLLLFISPLASGSVASALQSTVSIYQAASSRPARINMSLAINKEAVHLTAIDGYFIHNGSTALKLVHINNVEEPTEDEPTKSRVAPPTALAVCCVIVMPVVVGILMIRKQNKADDQAAKASTVTAHSGGTRSPTATTISSPAPPLALEKQGNNSPPEAPLSSPSPRRPPYMDDFTSLMTDDAKGKPLKLIATKNDTTANPLYSSDEEQEPPTHKQAATSSPIREKEEVAAPAEVAVVISSHTSDVDEDYETADF